MSRGILGKVKAVGDDMSQPDPLLFRGPVTMISISVSIYFGSLKNVKFEDRIAPKECDKGIGVLSYEGTHD